MVGHEPTLRQLNGIPAAEQFYTGMFNLFDTRPDKMRVVQDGPAAVLPVAEAGN